jgi:hypothetical protein
MLSYNDWQEHWTSMIEAWFKWNKDLLNKNEWPFSGNVRQLIHAMGEKIGQLGLFNVSLVGSKNPEVEWSMLARWSYGRQLGRIVDVLGPLVDACKEEDWAKKPAVKNAIAAFKEMEDEVREVKSSVEKRTH